jgi:hypothetical protein
MTKTLGLGFEFLDPQEKQVPSEKPLPIPNWVEQMHQHYSLNGFYRATDIQRVLGDPGTSVLGGCVQTLARPDAGHRPARARRHRGGHDHVISPNAIRWIVSVITLVAVACIMWPAVEMLL